MYHKPVTNQPSAGFLGVAKCLHLPVPQAARVCKPVIFPINESLAQTQTLYLADMDYVCLSPKADHGVSYMIKSCMQVISSLPTPYHS